MKKIRRREPINIAYWGGQISYLIDVCNILLCLQLLTPVHSSGKEGVRESSVWFWKVSMGVLNWGVPFLNHDTWAEPEEACLEVLPTFPGFCWNSPSAAEGLVHMSRFAVLLS